MGESFVPDLPPATYEAGRKLFAGTCDFVAGAATPDRIPADALPEIAFIGRSNVGKSSLINALTGRKALARTSHTPGRTQQLNFFDLGGRGRLVDMPGYGYAKVSKQDRALWDQLIYTYLAGRASLRIVCVLLDARHEVKDSDRAMMKMLSETAAAYVPVYTKCDKQKNETLTRRAGALKAELSKGGSGLPFIFRTSSHKGAGVEDLRAFLALQLGLA